MIKLMIIDDEAAVLNGLRQCIDWSAWGIDLSADATSAVEGREKALSIRPDILICDIHMPGRDGLALCDELKSLLPRMKIVILSGYNEPEYLHRALSIGVNEYLLKPAGVDTIVPAVLKLQREILEEQNKDREEDIRERLFIENLMVIRLQFINSLLAHCTENDEQLRLKAKMLGIPLQGPCYQTLLLRKYPEQADDCKSDIQLAMDYRRMIQSLDGICAKTPGSFYCEIETNDYLWLLSENDLRACALRTDALIAALRQAFPAPSSIAVAVGAAVSGVAQIADSYEHAVGALCRSAWVENQVVYESDAPPRVNGLDRTLATLEKRVVDALITQKSALCLELVAKAFTICRQCCYPIAPLKAMCKNILLLIAPAPEEGAAETVSSINTYRIDELYSGQELERWITHQLLLYFEDRDAQSSLCPPIIHKAVRYIHANYQSDITLQRLAKELFITPNYLGRLFHQETGCKMNDYLNRFRIERAKELLADPERKTSEVAEAVGFTSYKYFLVCFAKYANCNLRQFRAAGTQ